MKIIPSLEVRAQPVEEPDASKTRVRWLISRPEGAPNFAMRLFEVQPGGSTPLHDHPWEHEVYMLEGRAEAVAECGPTAVSPGDVVLDELTNKLNEELVRIGDPWVGA